MTMSIPQVNAFYIGALIALYERAIGFYGSLVNNNAYDQPGVEAGKKAASKLLELQKQVRVQLSHKGKIAEQIAGSVDGDPEQVFHLSHLASNDARINVGTGDEPADNRFSLRHSK
jgi:glucose-6-phosphate isomerase